MLCPVCKLADMKFPANGQESYVMCSECDAIKLNYEPLPHQQAFHADNTKFKMFAGG